MSEQMCKKASTRNWARWRCSRRAWKDGWCKQHHPDTVKARHAASVARLQTKRAEGEAARRAREQTFFESRLAARIDALPDEALFELGASIFDGGDPNVEDEWRAKAAASYRAALRAALLGRKDA